MIGLDTEFKPFEPTDSGTFAQLGFVEERDIDLRISNDGLVFSKADTIAAGLLKVKSSVIQSHGI